MKLEKLALLAETIGGAAIIVSLLVLIQEVRQNTAVQNRQIQIERYLQYTDSYIDPAAARQVYAKIKAIDGLEPLAEAYVERYGLTPEEAVLWSRLVSRTFYYWQVDYDLQGESEGLATEVSFVPRYPDAMLAFEVNEDELMTPEFRAFAESVWENEQTR